MRRREFISLLGGSLVAWPLDSRAQQPAAMPVIGFLDSRLPDAITDRLRAFRQGLKDVGYVEGENLAIVYRLANNRDDRLPELAADLAQRGVAVIATIPAVSSKARSLQTCRSCSRPSSNSSSTRGLPGCSASLCRRPYSPPPTR
jgi:putative ABC transport system substrate-binding protein